MLTVKVYLLTVPISFKKTNKTMQLNLEKEPLEGDGGTTSKNEPITKILLLRSDSNKPLDTIRRKLSNTVTLNHILGYKFKFEIPMVSVVKDDKVDPEEPYSYFFTFTQPLTERELEFWRWWKLGFLSHYYN